MVRGIITSENSTIIKIMTKKDKDYNTLSDKYVKLGEKHKTLMEVHAKTLRNEYNLTDKLKEQRREIVEDLKSLPLGADYIQNKLHQLTCKWEEKK